MFNLKLEASFRPFIQKGVTWTKQITNDLFGLADDEGERARTGFLSKEQKATTLEVLLEYIAYCAPCVAPDTIVRETCSLEDVWEKIRAHYNFESSGAQLAGYLTIKLEAGDQPNDLFQNMYSFIEDNLQRKGSSIKHEGTAVNEIMTPMVKNKITIEWLHRLHPDLPDLVIQKFGTELTTQTFYTLKPTLSKAIPSLLQQLENAGEARVMRIRPHNQRYQQRQQQSVSRPRVQFNRTGRPQSNFTTPRAPNQDRFCIICKQAGRPDVWHYITQCRYLPEADKIIFSKIRQIVTDTEQEEQIFEDKDVFLEHEQQLQGDTLVATQLAPVAARRFTAVQAFPEARHSTSDQGTLPTALKNALMELARPASTSGPRPAIIRRCQAIKSAIIPLAYEGSTVTMLLDSGAEINLISYETVHHFQIKLHTASQRVMQADGITPLPVAGEVHITLTFGSCQLSYDAIAVHSLEGQILAGMPFLKANNIINLWGMNLMIFPDGQTYTYEVQSIHHQYA